MRKIFSIFLFLILLLNVDVFAKEMRSSVFDERYACESSDGIWRKFGDSCIDKCRPKLDEFAICVSKFSYACGCGKNRCWNGETCIDLSTYKKIYEKEVELENKRREEAKKKRSAESAENVKEIMVKLTAPPPTQNGANNGQNNQQNNNTNPSAQKIASQPKPSSKKTSQIQIPPFFLQQEKAKNTSNGAGSNSSNSIMPQLPEVPLPN